MEFRNFQRGQGAQSNISNRFQKYSHEADSGLDEKVKTVFTEVHPKSIVNPVKSPDLSMEYSLNPYQGCEHGCSYCFARPTHEYWGFSAGIDFERKIMIKRDAPQLLEKFLQKRGYVPKTIVMSGNTDCYQPAEKKLEITRKLLEVFLKYRHPVSIITKNALLLRDLDLMVKLRELNLISVNLSIPTINEDLRRVMEPRTSSVHNKIKAIEILAQNDIPVNVMAAPVIPGLNSEEGFALYKAVSEAGARSAHHVLIRLNDTVEPVFTQWLETTFPERASKVLNLIRSMRGGNLGEKRFFERYKGEGNISQMIHNTFKLANRKYFSDKEIKPLSTEHFTGSSVQQLRLF